MRSKKTPYIFLAILAILAIILVKVKEKREQGTDKPKKEIVSKKSSKAKDINRDRKYKNN